MEKIRVLVVDDSVVIRRMVSGILDEDPDIEVVGTAVNGRLALGKIEQLAPDLVTMDIEMPELDGIEAVRQVRASGNRVPIIMFSTLSERGATATLDALAAGATDYVPKPANVGSVGRSIDQIRLALIPKVKVLGRPAPARVRSVPSAPAPARTPLRSAPAPLSPVATTTAVPAVPPVRPAVSPHPRLLVIGCSTGGPEALGALLHALPRLPMPVAVVQHMPAIFTRQFAARLDRQLPFDVVEAEQGQPLREGTVYIAPGDQHLHIQARDGSLVARLSQEEPENYCRPAVDVLFRSAAQALNGALLGVVLTGMGHDGREGARELVARGGDVLVQDEATSVVWGMPGAVAQAGLASEVLPLAQLGPAVVRRLLGARAVTAAVAR
ncbi:MAG: protein-glutamate methylesterase/protein-glutamine glutaminase [Nocardioides sp.]